MDTMTAPEEKKCTCRCAKCQAGNHCGNYGSGCQRFYGRR
jgi:hypothetical protein